MGFTPEEITNSTAPRNKEGEVVSETSKEEKPQLQLDIEVPEQLDGRTNEEITLESETNCFLEAIAKEIMSRNFDPENITLDARMQRLFIDPISRSHAEKPELSANLQEVGKLIPKLPKICEQFRTKIFELKDTGGPEFSLVENKGREIMMDLLSSVAEGHLTAEDFTRLVSNVRVKTRSECPDAGAEGIMFCDPRTGEITFLTEALVDEFKIENDILNLDFKHMVNHEISHRVVETSLKYNEKIVQIVQQIAANADLAPLLPMRIQNALKEYRDHPSRLCIEIMSDYSSLFITSNGTFRSFFDNCINKAVLAGKSEFIAALQIDDATWDAAVAQGADAKMALLQSNPKLSALVGTYKELHREIGKTLKAEKGTLGTREVEYGDGDEESDIYYEDYQGFQQATPGNSGQNQGRSHNGGSFLSTIGEMAKAFESDLNPVKQSSQ